MRYDEAIRFTSQRWPKLANWIEQKIGRHDDRNFRGRGRVNYDLQLTGLNVTGERRQLLRTLILVWIARGRDKCRNTSPNLHNIACAILERHTDVVYSDNRILQRLNQFNSELRTSDHFDFRERPELIVSGQKSVGYVQLQGTWGKVPTLPEWRHRIPNKVWDKTLKDSWSQNLFIYINQSLADYFDVNTFDASAAWDRLAVLGNLYFACDVFLKNDGKHHPPRPNQPYPNSKIGPHMWGLYVTVIDELCRTFDCKVNVLPQRLEECFGRVLTPHGARLDSIPAFARYITRMKFHKRELSREFFKLRFSCGKVYMRDRKHPTKWLPADSKDLGGVYCGGGVMMRPEHAGFALSMSRDLYMAKHYGAFPRDNFFHSSYLAGAAILCSGTIRIRDGVVLEITDESGHYQPTESHIVNLLEMLRIRGVDPKKIKVHLHYFDDIYFPLPRDQWPTGLQIISSLRKGVHLQDRFEANRELILQRQRLGGKPPFYKPPFLILKKPPRPS